MKERVGGGKPVGDAIFDVLLLGGSVPAYVEVPDQWMPLYVVGIVMVGVDFVLRLIGWLSSRTSVKQEGC